MHSKLDLHKHMSCEEIIIELDKCHHQSVFAKYLGRCNGLKVALNDCLQAEFDVNRKKHFEVAREKRRKYEEAWKDMEE
ncbi:hypothetical protein BGW38_005547 [Lunasporangiospora selenospora]|uniref:COX assembly mitochondrial protein n=1 Tax=Lunasporangiospora selenospora TaxID=979761 RepID=A0A9P6FMX4_9FUNG|nr:hypothetical protein BGW38_005547 [Lunasporangiospora selenospora]